MANVRQRRCLPRKRRIVFGRRPFALARGEGYEEVCLKDYEDGRSAARSLGTGFGFYNREQLHESLNCRVPEEGRFGTSARRVQEFSCVARSLAVG